MADRFELERLAGRGAMGEVWRAFDRQHGNVVALKVLTLTGKVAIERFRTEAAILARTTDPAIVAYVAHGMAEDPGPWIAMEWIEGVALDARLCDAPLSVDETLALARRLAEALAALHAAGVVHRDSKPENVLLPDGRAAEAKLVDLGVALARESGAPRPGVVVGTPGYIPPEQIRGEGIDARADLFGLGALLYECLAGAPAFEGEHPLAIFTKTLLDEPVPLAHRRADVLPELEGFVRALMAKEPAARPRDASEVVEAARALAGGVPSRVTVVSPQVGDDERTMVSILVGQRDVAEDATLDETIAVGERARLVALATRFGTRVEVVTSTSFAITAPRGLVGTDAPRRAVRCALALADVLPDHVTAVATVRADSTDPRALGEALERAATRLPRGARAEVGVAVDEVTAALLDGRFVIEDCGEGLAVLEERPGPPQPRSGVGAPFVGREAELAELRTAFARAVASGPEAVLVVGESGAGKSRLALELARTLEADVPGTCIVWARGDALRAQTPFSVAADVLQPILASADSRTDGAKGAD